MQTEAGRIFGAAGASSGTADNDLLIGTDGNDRLAGLAGDDTLKGLAGDDTLAGGTGDDRMVGDIGNDLYLVDNVGDVVVEAIGAGIDTVRSSINFTLGAHQEALILTGSALSGTGNGLANLLIGNAADNALSGLGGHDTLRGTDGQDTLSGGNGDDLFILNGGEVVIELAGQGLDRVQSSADCTLATHVENLLLTGSADLTGTGNGSGNELTGNAGRNLLSGLGGADLLAGAAGDDTLSSGSGSDTLMGGVGNDSLIGGLGDDDYFVDSASDVAVERIGGGEDKVRSSVSWTLLANFEGLTLTGSAALSGTGNSQDNVLTGNAWNNLLSGLGGDDTLNGGGGQDTLAGGKGDDLYVVNGHDLVSELVGEGTDRVQSSANFALGADLENLTLTGSAALSGRGNGLDNVLTGNAGNNLLDGLAGSDTMAGGGGNDLYVVGTAGDIVTEFADGGTDTVRSAIDFTLGDNVENLTLTGTASIDATGNALDNYLTGNAGDNVLDGAYGFDTLQGGAGNDNYMTDGNDRIMPEQLHGGTDTITSSGNVNLQDYFEIIRLTGTGNTSAHGNNQSNTIFGNSGNNYLMGGEMPGGPNGDDSIYGGEGNDSIFAGGGDDILRGGDGNDAIYADDGNDIGYGGDGDDFLKTDYGGDTLYGGAGNDFLQFGNPNGNELLSGGDGNDRLVSGLGSTATLDGGLGTDMVVGRLDGLTLISVEVWQPAEYHDLPFNASVAQLNGFERIKGGKSVGFTLTDSGVVDLSDKVGATNLTIRTSGDGNEVTLGRGDDFLVANGVFDTLAGGAGNDRFIVGNESAQASLVGGSGADTLFVDSYYNRVSLNGVTVSGIETLEVNRPVSGTPDQFEQFNTITNPGWHPVLTLTGAGTADLASELGSANTEITASALGNSITTGGGADTLLGAEGNDTLDGGVGDDTLTGGAGQDSFAFDLSQAGSGIDWVLDFSVADDVIQLAGAGLAAGALDASAFRNNTTGHAGDASDRIIYNRTTGTLTFDPDGSGPEAGTIFAILPPGLALAADGFWIE